MKTGDLHIETAAAPIGGTIKRIGMLTPSSNTVLEPMTAMLLREMPHIAAHFARFKVTNIALSDQSLAQFDDTEILRAAELLADAKVDVIAWNGTSASWLGFDRDERLVARIEQATGIKACTCVLGYRDIFDRTNVERVGLVTPYTTDVQARIVANWAAAGYRCTSEQHGGLADNFSFAEVSEAQIEAMVRAVVSQRCDAVAIVCTNMRGLGVAQRLEAELGVPIYDSVAVTLWACLGKLGVATEPLLAWGHLFQIDGAQTSVRLPAH
jgi:maleate isomerase